LETDENVYDFQEMFCRTPELGEHLSSLIVFPEILDRTARDGTPLTELIADQGLMLGITPTTGFQLLGGSQYEYLPRGLDGLAKRLAVWRERGASFVKWRVAARVLPGLPTERAMVSNARSVAEVAALAQQFDLVPIVEPEVEMQGEHSIERQFEVTEWFLHRTFEALYEQAAETIRCLRRVVPPAVPGIGFLSGGLSDIDSTANLDAINRLGPQPWALSFSYGRAIGRAAVEAWEGKTDESKGQTALAHRARMCGLASLGQWSSELEEAD
jgi:fructose-bisphosphate aldolase class I